MSIADFRALYSGVGSKNVKAINRFNNYELPFGYDQMTTNLEDLFTKQTDMVNRSAANSIQRGQKDVAARLASQGITGGSVMNNQVNKVTNDVNDNYAGILERLGIGRMQQDVGLMNQENANRFNITNAASNVDQQNINNDLQHAGLMSGILSGMQNQQNYEDSQPGFLDDLFSGISSIAQVALPFVMPGVGSVASAGLGMLNKGKGMQTQPTSMNTRQQLSPVNNTYNKPWNYGG